MNWRYSDCQFSSTAAPKCEETRYQVPAVRDRFRSVRELILVVDVVSREGLAHERQQQERAEEEREGVVPREAHLAQLWVRPTIE